MNKDFNDFIASLDEDFIQNLESKVRNKSKYDDLLLTTSFNSAMITLEILEKYHEWLQTVE